MEASAGSHPKRPASRAPQGLGLSPKAVICRYVPSTITPLRPVPNELGSADRLVRPVGSLRMGSFRRGAIILTSSTQNRQGRNKPLIIIEHLDPGHLYLFKEAAGQSHTTSISGRLYCGPGVNTYCGTPMHKIDPVTAHQFREIFESLPRKSVKTPEEVPEPSR